MAPMEKESLIFPTTLAWDILVSGPGLYTPVSLQCQPPKLYGPMIFTGPSIKNPEFLLGMTS